jgi:hypothetical protein
MEDQSSPQLAHSSAAVMKDGGDLVQCSACAVAGDVLHCSPAGDLLCSADGVLLCSSGQRGLI